MKDFGKDFVERTQIIVDTYKEKYEFTLLINSLLGLTVLVHEKYKNNKRKPAFLENFIKDINEFDFLHTISYIANAKVYEFLVHFRNAIAHTDIKPINYEEEWKEIEMKDIDTKKSIILSYSQTKAIANYISSEYLEYIKNPWVDSED